LFFYWSLLFWGFCLFNFGFFLLNKLLRRHLLYLLRSKILSSSSHTTSCSRLSGSFLAKSSCLKVFWVFTSHNCFSNLLTSFSNCWVVRP
jgi:hypothetical protein